MTTTNEPETYGSLTPEQFARLPKHGQRTIRELAAALDRAQKARDEARRELAEGPADSRVYVDMIDPDQPNRQLGNDPTVVFDLGNSNGRFNDTVAVEFDKQGRTGTLEISAGGMADELVIAPVTYNRFRVFLASRKV